MKKIILSIIISTLILGCASSSHCDAYRSLDVKKQNIDTTSGIFKRNFDSLNVDFKPFRN